MIAICERMQEDPPVGVEPCLMERQQTAHTNRLRKMTQVQKASPKTWVNIAW